MLAKVRRLNQFGDTMIEVLISMAIVSTILGGAYVASNKSLLSIRDAQEHVDALKLADGQVELLKATPPAPAIRPSFCYVLNPASGSTPQAVSYSDANCTLTSKGVLATNGVQPAYKVDVTYNSSNQIYSVQIVWDTITGQMNGGRLTLFYRTGQ